MKKKKHVEAIFTFSDNVSQLLTDALAFYKAISTAPGDTHVSIPAADITTAQGHVTTAQTAEGSTNTRLQGTTDNRDIAVNVVITDVMNFVALVQIAVNNALTPIAAAAIVTDCGLHTRKQ